MISRFANALELGIVGLDAQGRVRMWNRWMAERSGRSREEVLGLALKDVFPEAANSRLEHAIDLATRQRLPALLSPALSRVRLALYHRPQDRAFDRRMVHLIHVVPYEDDEDSQGCLLQITDVTMSAHREQVLRNKEHQLRNAARIAQLGTWEWDLEEGSSVWSDELYRILGLSRQTHPPGDWAFLSLVHPQERDQMAEAVEQAAQGGADVECDCTLVLADGSHKHVHFQAEVSRDAEGRAVSLLCTVQDISERKRMEAELRELAATDALTGLPNRRHFMLQLGSELARVQRQPSLKSALLMLDLDHFKLVNDNYGHGVGDAVLRHFAELAGNEMRKVDTLGRLGGEEFAILLPDTDLPGAQFVAERLRQRVESSAFLSKGQPVALTVSVGIGLIDPADHSVEAVLARCDQALYVAKRKGRNRVELNERPAG